MKFWNEKKAFGFITPDDGEADVFVHRTALGDAEHLRLFEGELVEFKEVFDDRKGKTFAADIKAISREDDVGRGRVASRSGRRRDESRSRDDSRCRRRHTSPPCSPMPERPPPLPPDDTTAEVVRFARSIARDERWEGRGRGCRPDFLKACKGQGFARNPRPAPPKGFSYESGPMTASALVAAAALAGTDGAAGRAVAAVSDDDGDRWPSWAEVQVARKSAESSSHVMENVLRTRIHRRANEEHEPASGNLPGHGAPGGRVPLDPVEEETEAPVEEEIAMTKALAQVKKAKAKSRTRGSCVPPASQT